MQFVAFAGKFWPVKRLVHMWSFQLGDNSTINKHLLYFLYGFFRHAIQSPLETVCTVFLNLDRGNHLSEGRITETAIKTLVLDHDCRSHGSWPPVAQGGCQFAALCPMFEAKGLFYSFL